MARKTFNDSTPKSNSKRENRDREMASSAIKDAREDDVRSGRTGKNNKWKGKKSGNKRNVSGKSGTVVSKSNPFEWYNAFPQVIKDAGNIPFGIPLGTILDQTTAASKATPADNVPTPYSVPGIMAIEYLPSIGWSEDRTSPINRSATKMFVYLRTQQKAAKDYDSQDMMMMIVALDSCYAFHQLMRRAYGLMQLFTPVNKYLPRTLLRASGFSYKDLEANLSDFRAYINQFAISLGSYTLPGNIDFLKRHKWMNEGLYTDQDSAKAQMYMFVPTGFWQYDNTVATGSQLTLKPWLETNMFGEIKTHTFAEIKEYGNALLNAILGDEDAAFISGDLLAAFGQQVMAQIEETPDNYRVLPAYDPVVLSQIQNATLVGGYYYLDASAKKITQDPSVNAGAIIFTPKITQQLPGLQLKPLLNVYDLGVSHEEVVEMTRLTAMSTTPYSENVKAKLDVIPADIALSANIYFVEPTSTRSDKIEVANVSMSKALTVTDPSGLSASLQFMSRITAFDWAPRVAAYVKDETASRPMRYRWSGYWWECDNVTMLEESQLAALQEAAFTSLFNVPEMSFTIKAPN